MNPLNNELIGCQSYGIFWDIENCPIPVGEMATNVIKNIKQFIATNYEEKVGQKSEPCAFYCSCDTRKLDPRVVEALNRTGVDLLHVNPIRALNNTTNSMSYKVDADSKLKECIQKYVDHHFNKQKCRLFVITGDIDFAPAIRSAKRRGFEVILLYGTNTSQEMKESTESYSYNDIVDKMDKTDRSDRSDRSQCMFIDAPIITNASHSPRNTSLLNTIPTNREIGATSSIKLAPSNELVIPPSVKDIEEQNQNRSKGTQKTKDIELDPNAIKTVEEFARVERHVAIQVLKTTKGNINLALNCLLGFTDD